MTIRLEEMRSFVAVADEGSFSAAARVLGRSQSVVSTHIAGMENELGFKLFVREPAPVLTPAARELLPSARRVIAEAARFESRASALYRLPEPLLYIGIDMGLDIPPVLDLIRDFSKTFPSAKLQIENISSTETGWFFKKSAMTMALVFSRRTAPDCEEYVIGHAPLCIAVAKKHPLTEGPLTHERLRSFRQIVVAARDSESDQPAAIADDTWEVDSGQWAVGLAARGVGWTVVPKSVVLAMPRIRSMLTLLDPPYFIAPERLVLLTRRDEVPANFVEWWRKAATRAAGKLGLAAASAG